MFKSKIPNILKSIKDHPEGWVSLSDNYKQDGVPYSIMNKDTGVCIWTASGIGYYRIDRKLLVDLSLTFLDQYRFHFAFKEWLKLYRGPISPNLSYSDYDSKFIKSTFMHLLPKEGYDA